MRHRVQDKKFNRNSNERKALLNGLLRALVERGSIETTLVKGKVLKRLADRVISRAKDDTLNSRRVLHRTFGKRDVVNTLVEVVAPAAAKRTSGFTRVIPMGKRRGDNTPMVRVELVDMPSKVNTLVSGKEYAVRAKAPKKAAAPKAPAKAAPAKKAAAPKAAKPTKKAAKK
jgi:large subunit ribosomal protein L17